MRKKLLIIYLVILALFVFILGALFKLNLDLNEVFEKANHPIEKELNLRDGEVNFNNKDAFSFLFLGIDTGDLGREEVGRSDAIMIGTVNPNEKKTTLVSVPRDTRMLIVGKDMDDKINHAYAFGGPKMSINSLEKYFNVPIDKYVSLNMKGLGDLVDAVNGIKIQNSLEFTSNGYEFPLGLNHLNGKQTLAYVRMRYDDPNNDYGRQERQRKVVSALVSELIKPEKILKYSQIMDIVQQNLKTNMTFNEIKTIVFKYKDCFQKQELDQLLGKGQMIDDISYQVVSEEERNRVATILNMQLDLRK
ncbi:LCP family glycopolymer transferase [Enterococcus faecalis]|uniref:LCP family glycopolymer transferase n=1 Tax=Enterococcus faecalis TaxID=1351 RepID=UPI0035E845BA